MAKYLIHCCEKRKWYVDKYLIPSMLKQGIHRENILIYNDAEKQGNLRAFVMSSSLLPTDTSGTWHLQDDVIISSNFKVITEEFDRGIVCGFCNKYSEDLPVGIRPVRDMWYSFPCIRIPNAILKGFIEWLNTKEVQNKYRVYIEANKFDDTLFRAYVLSHCRDKLIHNLYPNIVDNVDYMIGGSIINYQRSNTNVDSIYFFEKEIKETLEKELQNTIYNKN